MDIRRGNQGTKIGSALGIGLIAGVAGTAAITISQFIEMRISKRKPSQAPLKVAEQVASVTPKAKEATEKVSQEIHWAYGTSWGLARGIISLAGLRGLPAIAAHFAAVWGTSLFLLPAFNAGPNINEESPKAIGVDVLHHAVYALAAGVTFDALDDRTRRRRKLEKWLKQTDRLLARLKVK